MPTIAEKLVKKPTAEIQQLVSEVQDVANDSQSFAYRFEDMEDGSRLEIRCAPVPRLQQIPDGPVDHAGALAQVDGELLRVFPLQHVHSARADLDARLAACDAADPDEEDTGVQALRQATAAAITQLEVNLEAGAATDSHVAIPADEKTAAFVAELGEGGHQLIAH